MNGNGGGPAKNANKIRGSNNDDILIGTDEIDSITGRRGDDFLVGGLGEDMLDGDEGVDTASYATSAAGVTVNLALGTGLGGDAEGDILIEIENLIGSSFGDHLAGDAGTNILDGGDGDDTLDGGDGVDELIGGDGNDTLLGGAGNDDLTGGDGDDTLDGGSGADYLFAGIGDDTLEGGAGADRIFGGAGNDTASYANATSRVVVDVFNGGTEGDAAGDLLLGIENLIGSAFNDILNGDLSDNQLFGGDGADVLDGDGGDDLLDGGSGGSELAFEFLIGGDGSDTVTYENSTAAVAVNLSTGFAQGGDADFDLLFSIENLIGSAYGDILIGEGLTASLIGGDGDDFLAAGASGQDTVTGGAGGDIFSLGFFGLTNQNPLSGDNLTTITDFEVGVDLLHLPVEFFSLSANAQQVGDDVLINVSFDTDVLLLDTQLTDLSQEDLLLSTGQLIIGTNGDDDLIGTLSSDTIIGFAGNDLLIANQGEDRLFGGDGNDILLIDRMHTATGGDGFDVFGKLIGILENQNTPFSSTEATVVDFEIGTDLIAFNGDPFDVLADTVQSGSDVVISQGGFSAFRLLDTQLSDLSASDFVFIPAGAIFGTNGADDLLGTGDDDIILGFDGDDRFENLLFGSNSLTGGGGADTFSFFTNGVIIGALSLQVTAIEDFEIGIDQVEFAAAFAFDVLGAARQEGADVAIEYREDFELVLRNTMVEDLQASDFVFV